MALATRYPLAAITNGNADPGTCGLSDYFQFVLRADSDGRAKPDSDMYHQAAKKFDLPLKTLLHVGDNLTTNVAGALRCGMQTCWFNHQQKNIMSIQDGRLLPHIEISRLASLSALL